MNMISTGSFLTETGASNKQSELVKKLTAAWEKKNSKTARAGGASLMALSLAACGGEDNTPFSQVDVDAAKAEGVASVDITSDNADAVAAALTATDGTVYATVDAAVTAGAASVDITSDNAAAKTEALTAADGTIYATVDAAYTAGSNLSNSDAVTAALTGSDGTVYASVDAAVTSNDSAIEAAATATAQANTEASLVAGSGFDSVAALLAAYNDATSPAAASYAMSSSSTTADAYTGGAGVDTITATSSSYQAGDIVIGGAGNDSLTIAATAAVSAATMVSGVETVTVNVTSFADIALDLDNIKDYTTITVNNLQSGGTTGANLDNIEAGGTIVLGSGVTGNLDLEIDGAVTVDAGSASNVVADVNATTAQTTITANSATGGTATSLTNADIQVTEVDNVVINSTSAKFIIAHADADAADTTDAVTINAVNQTATGTIGLDLLGAANTAVELITLSGNGGKATYVLDASDVPETVTFTGDQVVELRGTSAQFTTETVVDSTEAGTGSIVVTSVGATTDLGNVGSTIELAHTNAQAAAYDLANNASVVMSATAGESVTLATDQTAVSSETLTLTLEASQNTAAKVTKVEDFETVNLIVNDGLAATNTITVTDLDGNDTAGTVINVSGVDNLTLSGANSAHLNAAELEGKLTVTVATDMKTITGGSGNDVINLADFDVTIDGGAGTDTLDIATGNMDLSNNTISLTNIEVINIDSGDGNSDDTLTFLGSQITGQSWIITGTDHDTNNTEDILAVTMDGTSLDLSTLTVDAADVDVAINVASVNALAHSIEGTAAVDSLSNVGAGAITINGYGGADTITTGTGADTIDGGAGADVIDAAAGDDTITGGEGGDTITTGGGDDTVILTEATAAEDTVKITGTTGDVITITGFTAGGTSTSDDLEFTLTKVEGLTAVTNFVDSSGANETAATTTLLKVTDKNTDIGASTAGIITIEGDFADSDALETAIETGGSLELVFGAWASAGDGLLVAYDNGVDTTIAALTTTAAIANGAKAATGDLVIQDYVILSGVSDATSLLIADFDDIA